MGEPRQGQQVCPRCKLISPATATTCDCGYDLCSPWDAQPSAVREKPRRPGTRVVGAFLACLGVFASAAIWIRGIPEFHAWPRLETLLQFAVPAVSLFVGVVLLFFSFLATPRGR
jgi:hypothetical protein